MLDHYYTGERGSIKILPSSLWTNADHLIAKEFSFHRVIRNLTPVVFAKQI